VIAIEWFEKQLRPSRLHQQSNAFSLPTIKRCRVTVSGWLDHYNDAIVRPRIAQRGQQIK
jgi:hypothetical protein